MANSVMPRPGALTHHDPNNKFWANDTSGFGFRMLQKMGWSPGKGLGANEDGETKRLPLVLKLDNTGIGAQKNYDHHWQESIEDYKGVLGKLKELKAPNVDENSNTSEESEGSSEVSEKVEKKRDGKKLEGKKKRKRDEGEKKSKKRKREDEGEEKQTKKRRRDSDDERKKKKKKEERKKRDKSEKKVEKTEKRKKKEKNGKRKSRELTKEEKEQIAKRRRILEKPQGKNFSHFIQRKQVISKSVSNYSQDDLNAIFGIPLTNMTEAQQKKELALKNDALVKSNVSMTDYFKAKSAEKVGK